ncbi:MAG: PIN domain-containing protein [Pseudanabaena sp. M046S1SP1A06QC]|nr:PIN domain-containing protein [Pseudanabaena sp. M046S1SP1A06QC]
MCVLIISLYISQTLHTLIYTLLLASELSQKHKLSFADSIIYATAQQENVKLITSDNHFEGLPDVIYFSKKS